MTTSLVGDHIWERKGKHFWWILEKHKDCACSYCMSPGLKIGLNIPKAKKGWWILHWKRAGYKYYLRLT